jgi:hypothetical protein
MNIGKLFRFVTVFLTLLGVTASSFAQATSQQSASGSVLTGDPATACEVILCLSSGSRPSECNAPLARYFSISLKYWSDTVTARRNFLNECPAASQTSTANMPALVDAMVNGAGRCDAASLNQIMVAVPVQQCTGSGDNESCWTDYVYVVNPTEPAYCTPYTTNVNTYMLGVQYVGEPLKGGHWVDAAVGQ